MNYPHLRSIYFFSPDLNGIYQKQHSGYETFTRTTQSKTMGFTFPLNVQSNKKQTFYFRISSDSPIIIPLTVLDADSLFNGERLKSYAYGSFYGIFVAMGLFNLFIFYTTRDKSYLFYVLYIASIFLFTLSYDGVLRKILPLNNPADINYANNIIMTMGPIIFGALFCQHFLQTKETQPIIHQCFWGIIFLCLLNIALILTISTYSLYSSVFILTTLIIIAALTSGITALKQRIATARFFLIAWLFLITGSIFWLLTLKGVIPFNDYSALSIHIGATLEAILLSMALGDKINRVQKENKRIEAQAKQQLEESNRLLTGGSQFKEAFLSVISHELRTPMNGIYGATALLEFTDISKEQEEHLETIKQSSNDMLSMIENILTLTQSEAGTLSKNNERINLPKLIEKLSKDIELRCIDKNLTYTTYIHPEVPAVIQNDKGKLALVLIHLLDNAIKFTDHGNIALSVTLATEITTKSNNKSNNKPRIKQKNTTVKALKFLRFTIKDTGCGVPSDKQASIFESFRQADNSLTRQHGGLGIGLALCKRIVDVLQGSLTFESTVNLGTTVSVVFEHSIPANDPSIKKTSHLPSNITRGKKVLVVEDNPVNKLVISSLLKEMNLTVFDCNNGQEAVNFASHNDIDLILMDCQMPIMDGYEATKVIRTLSGPISQVPIIAVTANTNPGDKLHCLEAGMNDYLKKPITLVVLAERMGKWF